MRREVDFTFSWASLALGKLCYYFISSFRIPFSTHSVDFSSISIKNIRMLNRHVGSELVSFSSSSVSLSNDDTNLVQRFVSFTHTHKITRLWIRSKNKGIFQKITFYFSNSVDSTVTVDKIHTVWKGNFLVLRLPDNNKHIQMYTKKQSKHSSFSRLLFGKNTFPKFVEEKKIFSSSQIWSSCSSFFFFFFLQDFCIYYSECLYLFLVQKERKEKQKIFPRYLLRHTELVFPST